MRISVICVYNDNCSLQNQLLDSLQKQNVEYELILLDNREHAFQSAAEALNKGVCQAKGDILIFSHQDIYLKTWEGLEKLADQIEKYPVGTIVGTQGIKEKSKLYYSNLTTGMNYNKELLHRFEEQPYQVSCVDEGLFGMRRKTWEQHPFDEKICDNWHLYCVEACLYARKNGHGVYAIPIQIHHFSRGQISLSYMKNLKSLCKKYRKDFRYIWTTCYKVRTNVIYINCLYCIWVANRAARRRLY